jgi:glutathione S-transferase
MTGTLTIYGDSISGNCLKIKYVCTWLKIPYRWIEIDIQKGQSRTPEFLAMSPAGQVPVVTLADGRVLSQSNAIIVHLAEGSNLIPTDAYDRALMFQWLFWEQYTHEPAIAVRRFQKVFLRKSDDEIDPALTAKCKMVLALMDGHLAKQTHFVGDRLTLADVALVAYTRMYNPETGFDLAGWPHVKAWVKRIETELNL